MEQASLSPRNPIEQEIEVLIRARYPVLYLVTPEENRVGLVLRGIAQRRQKKLMTWSCSAGLGPAGAWPQSPKQRQSPTRDPLLALDQVVDLVDPAIYLFLDLHPFLTRPNYAVIRKLKETAQQLKDSAKTLILVSPVLELPVELEKEVVVLNFPLPAREELDQLLRQILDELAASRQVRFDLSPVERENLINAALGLTRNEAENVFAKILVQTGQLTGHHTREIAAEKRQIIRKHGLLDFIDAAETLADIGGLDTLKDWLRKRASAFTRQARDFGLPTPKGILLLGIQGCGKSLCAKAVATLWQWPLLRFDMGRMFNSFIGSSEENMRRAIAIAESVAPAIFWIDEMDKAFSGIQGSHVADGGTTARVLGTFLTWLSEKTAPVFVVATANDLSPLPPELLRKGRLDEIFFVDLPEVAERCEIFAIHLAKRSRNPAHYDLALLADHARDFSGAEIEQAIISALYDVFDAQRDLTTQDILNAIHETVPLAKTMDEQISRLRKWADGRARNASVGLDTKTGVAPTVASISTPTAPAAPP